MLSFVLWLIVVLVAIAAAAVIALRSRGRHRRPAPAPVEQLPPPEVREALLRRSVPVLYFTQSGAPDIRRLQDPAIFMLSAEFEDRVSVIKLDLAASPALAELYGVKTAPVTIVLDHRGRIAAVNRGYVRLDELRRQVLGARSLDWAMGS